MAFIPANIGGNGGTAESLTPSNSTPAQITSGNDYHATAGGYAIESYDSVTPSSTPESVSSGDIVKIGGSGVIVDTVPPTPTSITPSNATPVALTADAPVNPTTAGYAIESYNTKTPSNVTPASLVSGEIDKMGGAGYAIESYTTLSNLQISVSAGDMLRANGAGKVAMLQQLTPSNTNPPSIDYVGGYYAAPTSGYVISSYSSVTPSSTPTSVSAGNMIQINGSGAIVDAVTSIIPSNSSPVSLSSGNFYKPSASGYAISSYSSKTPSDTNPPSISSGAIIKASSAGYLVKNAPINFSKPDVISHATMSGNTTRTIAVTKMPRFIIYGYSRTNANGYGGIFFIDVERDMYGYDAYGGSGFASNTETSGTSNRVTSITSSSVTVAAGATYEVRTYVAIWY